MHKSVLNPSPLHEREPVIVEETRIAFHINRLSKSVDAKSERNIQKIPEHEQEHEHGHY